ncbi:NADPH oxidoreductase, putative flavodoxin quinone reductase FqrB [Campylobacter pinnipediorum subsp. caledonicus]|uniref:NADPH oxidoreductase, putative flavodoxin quinone reductase FqrB n=1 Tax=Campylobacter pinnipediorum subsp. caledonicus TaxID=1874362 RepID=A0A1S6U8E0_9BACT|nr:NAD(P)-binding domain-containing protein [Campylobacter pinnipediorum]AQW88014.1 NADPH oxidoreductase, putative flavodoxin quinone reductase FqrB [Campylobacter pinnipediorum subsp. caledonicus]
MSVIYDLVVIGAGPCGIGAAIEAKANGLNNVLMLEKGEENLQTIRKFYKDNKRVDKEYKGQESTIYGVVAFQDGTKETTIEFFDKIIAENNIECVFKCEVESVKKVGDLFEITTTKDIYKSKNVLVSIGKMGKPNKPDYKIPLPLNGVVNFNLDKCGSGEKILVVGGGNSAVEYAIDLCKNNETTLAYRRDTFARVNDTNKENLEILEKDNKLKVRLNHDIVSLDNDNGKVVVNFSNDKTRVYDRVVYAIGGSSPVDFLQKCGIKMDDKGNALVNDACESDIAGLYAGGDITLKNGGSIVIGLNHAYKVVQNIIKK